MALRVPMGAPRLLVIAMFALVVASQGADSAQSQPPAVARADSSRQQASSSLSAETIHQKTDPDSVRPARHTHAREEDSFPPELAQAEELIQKNDYSAAEPLLRKAVESDPKNYVAWFDLGFV